MEVIFMKKKTREKKARAKKSSRKYNSFLQDTKAIIIPRPMETFRVSTAVIMSSILFGLFFVVVGKLITILLSYIF